MKMKSMDANLEPMTQGSLKGEFGALLALCKLQCPIRDCGSVQSPSNCEEKKAADSILREQVLYEHAKKPTFVNPDVSCIFDIDRVRITKGE
ncbi:unnamed protein product [Dovyalis caffra]|uniref:Uncharacterized protein n=1 Tax=Dovyalis caffra TaxID=77055 RepID=A0AAV1SPV2_9ROSI|nr:unnamed protein product [Dovyalis caffra]